jgi:hypothetical protein
LCHVARRRLFKVPSSFHCICHMNSYVPKPWDSTLEIRSCVGNDRTSSSRCLCQNTPRRLVATCPRQLGWRASSLFRSCCNSGQRTTLQQSRRTTKLSSRRG